MPCSIMGQHKGLTCPFLLKKKKKKKVPFSVASGQKKCFYGKMCKDSSERTFILIYNLFSYNFSPPIQKKKKCLKNNNNNHPFSGSFCCTSPTC